jgi:general secretion pathway protein E
VIINDRMRVMIHDGAGEHELEREARQVTLGIRDDGRAKVLSGATSLEELFRVARESDGRLRIHRARRFRPGASRHPRRR